MAVYSSDVHTVFLRKYIYSWATSSSAQAAGDNARLSLLWFPLPSNGLLKWARVSPLGPAYLLSRSLSLSGGALVPSEPCNAQLC
jgi:hypothetical protein